MIGIRALIKQEPLLFDGGMGTYLSAIFKESEQPERANLLAPEKVAKIHGEYLAAGARAIKTNTFGCNRSNYDEDSCLQVLEAGWKLANDAAGEKAYVFADIGPVGAEAAPDEEYCFLAEKFLKLGACHFLFETNSSNEGLKKAAELIKSECPDAFILISYASLPDGFTRSGLSVKNLLTEASQWDEVDAVGLNCVCGAAHMRRLAEKLGKQTKCFSAMPNAGYPTVLGNRTFYSGTPEYFALQAQGLREVGAQIIGGCCGTTPAHIAALAQGLQSRAPEMLHFPAEKTQRTESESHAENHFWAKLNNPDEKPFAVELDPPEAADVSRFMTGALELQESGASLLTIADCPIARARMDSSLLACKIHRELQMEAMPHMTCRDRNINATKALLLGLCAEDVHYVLAVTGDPIPSSERDEVKSVFNFNSRKLAAYIRDLSASALPVPFQVFGALNINARNFEIQLRMAKEKEANGMCGFFTQPVLTEAGFENLKLAKKELNGFILGGIIPIISERNALFMANEVSGISIDPKVIDLYSGANREEAEELAVNISAEIAERIADYVDGYYLITPFGRTKLIARIMQEIRRRGV